MYCNFSIADADCGCGCGCGMRMRNGDALAVPDAECGCWLSSALRVLMRIVYDLASFTVTCLNEFYIFKLRYFHFIIRYVILYWTDHSPIQKLFMIAWTIICANATHKGAKFLRKWQQKFKKKTRIGEKHRVLSRFRLFGSRRAGKYYKRANIHLIFWNKSFKKKKES